MGLEVGDGFISGLVATNPVGATDPKSQGDDHIRLIKTALLGTFPNLSAAVSLTASQINDAALKSAANSFTANQTIAKSDTVFVLKDTGGSASDMTAYISLQDSSTERGWMGFGAGNTDFAITNNIGSIKLNGVNTTDFARLSQNNAFTGNNTFIGADATYTFKTGGATARLRSGYNGVQMVLNAVNTAESAAVDFEISAETLALSGGTAVTLNGVASTDFARLSQSNTFTGATQTISAANAALVVADTGGTISTLLLSGNGTSGGVVGTSTNHKFDLFTNNTARYSISSGGNHDFKSGTATFGGAVTAPTIATSSSTTLVAGQIHFISGTATLPNLTAGQWVQVVNDSGSPITINVNGSDTTSWTATGATISTSFTLGSRGVLTAICSPSGSNVYVSGSGITSAS